MFINGAWKLEKVVGMFYDDSYNYKAEHSNRAQENGRILHAGRNCSVG